VKVERVEARPLADKHRDELIVRAVEDMQERASHWWQGQQEDAVVIALRDGKGNVSIFDAVLRRAVELDARELPATVADVRAALDRTCA
jgi:NAD(P)H-hydrate repair Nnr-like enzyme with NAD(P)H-hydrate dehydratase domain